MAATSSQPSGDALLVIGAHAGDFVWRDGLRRDEIKHLRRAEATSAAARMALQARVLAQAAGYDAPGEPGEPVGAPPVFFFECLAAQQHRWDHCTDLAKRREVQLKRNDGPDLGLSHGTMGEAYIWLHPETTGTPA